MKAWWCALVVYGALSVALPSGWLIARPTKGEHRYGEFLADPTKTRFHVAGCPYLHCSNPARFPHLSAAEAFGSPCPHCLSELTTNQVIAPAMKPSVNQTSAK